MEMVEIPRAPFSVSELCYGVMPFGTRVRGTEAHALLNRFRDAGGNFLDTAHVYAAWLPGGDGASERAVGEYLRENGGRDELVIATKGAHPSIPGYRSCPEYMSPGRIGADIDDSLGRMGIDVIDLYWLHRDDPRLPVGDIVEMLNTEIRRGRIRCFGGSNWTAERLDEANRYAVAHALAGPVASQPSWCLAPRTPFANDQHVFDEDDYRIHLKSKLPVVPYSPTGTGFFATDGERGAPYKTAENLARLARAKELAGRLGTTPNRIALAWLRAQPFPVIPILGTADPRHLEDALGSVEVNLATEQVRWLASG